MNHEDKQEAERAKLARDIREMHELLPMRADLERALARIVRVKFLALTAEGFTPEQALELCKKP
jgi:hypothetical protein